MLVVATQKRGRLVVTVEFHLVPILRFADVYDMDKSAVAARKAQVPCPYGLPPITKIFVNLWQATLQKEGHPKVPLNGPKVGITTW
jgi:hypothetical protein